MVKQLILCLLIFILFLQCDEEAVNPETFHGYLSFKATENRSLIAIDQSETLNAPQSSGYFKIRRESKDTAIAVLGLNFVFPQYEYMSMRVQLSFLRPISEFYLDMDDHQFKLSRISQLGTYAPLNANVFETGNVETAIDINRVYYALFSDTSSPNSMRLSRFDLITDKSGSYWLYIEGFFEGELFDYSFEEPGEPKLFITDGYFNGMIFIQEARAK